MRSLLFLMLGVLCSFAALSQHNGYPKLPPLPPGREKSTKLPPLRGQKDLRPRQFSKVPPAKFSLVDISGKIINELPRLKKGDVTEFPLANLTPMRGELISKRQTSTNSAYAFRIQNEVYKNAVLFINVRKDENGLHSYFGHVLRPGYSDVLKLQYRSGRVYFAPEEAQKVVLD